MGCGKFDKLPTSAIEVIRKTFLLLFFLCSFLGSTWISVWRLFSSPTSEGPPVSSDSRLPARKPGRGNENVSRKKYSLSHFFRPSNHCFGYLSYYSRLRRHSLHCCYSLSLYYNNSKKRPKVPKASYKELEKMAFTALLLSLIHI